MAECDVPSLMLLTPGCWARDDMGAALAGVFWGVLAGRTLECGTSMLGVCDGGVWARPKLCGGGEGSDLRGGDGVHLLIADRLRHLGK